MAIKRTDEEIWYWYEKIEDYRKSGLPATLYCRSNNLDSKKFNNMRITIEYIKYSKPKIYEEYLPAARKYLESGGDINLICAEYNVDKYHLGNMTTHLRYLEVIEKMKKVKGETESKPMSFIQVPPKSSVKVYTETPVEPEVVEKQNELEIMITKGVKVSISPNIHSMKIIKIIELLKDL